MAIYRPFLSPKEIIEGSNISNDIQSRITELENNSYFDDGQNQQTVSFPDDSSSSFSCIDSASSSSSISLNEWDISSKELSNNPFIVNNDCADTMDID